MSSTQGPLRRFALAVSASWLLVPYIACSNAIGAEEADNQQHAHVHGVATLGIAVQDNVLTIQFESPLDSVIGFEHRANTPAERAVVEELQIRMKAPGDLFRPTAAAGCKLQKAEAESAIFQAPTSSSAAEEHADLDASFEYRCERIERLTSIETGLFDAYPRMQRIAIEVATGKGQFKRDLKRPARTIALVR